MKFLPFLLSITLTFLVNLANAQGKLKEGVLFMELTEVESEDPETAGMLSGMRGSTQDIYFSEQTQKVIMNMMGGLVSTTSITDMVKKESRTYVDMMGQKIMVKSPVNPEDAVDETMDIKFDPSKTKTIQGYHCKYASMVPKDNDDGAMVEIYYTDDIQLLGSISSQLNTGSIKGAPLEMTISAQGFKMKYETKKISNSINKDAFAEPKGYKEMSLEEFQRMTGGMGF
jgi:hypothetical protein